MNQKIIGINLTGQQFRELKVVGLSDRRGNGGQKLWDCICSCGNPHTVFQQSLLNGLTTHCADHPKNSWREENGYAVMDVSSPIQPDATTKLDIEDVQRVIDYRGRGGRLRWFAHDSSRKKGYWGNYVVATDRKTRLHRFVMRLTDPQLVVDHINGDTLDNRKENLRVITKAENNKNVRKRVTNTSGFTGVTLSPRTGLWRSGIWLNHKYFYLGEFDTKHEAAIAYMAAAKVLEFSERRGK